MSASLDVSRKNIQDLLSKIARLNPEKVDPTTIIQLAEQLLAAGSQLQSANDVEKRVSQPKPPTPEAKKLTIHTTSFIVKPNIGFREEVKVTGGVAPYSLYFLTSYPEGVHIRERMWLVGATSATKQINICVRDACGNHAEGMITLEVKRNNELLVIPTALAVYQNGKSTARHK